MVVGIGLLFAGFAFWMSPRAEWDVAGTAPSGSEAGSLDRKAQEVLGQLQDIARSSSEAGVPNIQTGEPRVFVSRTLVFVPQEGAEPIQPLDPKLVTSDGIQVGWKLQYGFAPQDPRVAGQDPDQDGFSNLEEFKGGTDPLSKESSPPKWIKLRVREAENRSLRIGFSEKTRGMYGLRFEASQKFKKNLLVNPGESIWVYASKEALEIFPTEADGTAWIKKSPAKAEHSHLIPLQVLEYRENKGKREDPKTPGVQVDFDDSEVVLQRKDGVPQELRLMIELVAYTSSTGMNRSRARGVEIDASVATICSLVPGEGILGTFQVGDKLPYGGAEFGLEKVEKRKAVLKNLQDGKEISLLPETP